MNTYYHDMKIPESKIATGKICHITDLTGINADLDYDIHNGFTIGKGKKLYWMMIWHKSGHVTVFRAEDSGKPDYGRWIDGDTEITVHFK